MTLGSEASQGPESPLVLRVRQAAVLASRWASHGNITMARHQLMWQTRLMRLAQLVD